MERQYRNHLSGYLHWDQLVHAEDWLLFEKNIGAYTDQDTESKGFYDPVIVQDFPLRGKKVFLNIRRRRWLLKKHNEYISRNWRMVAEGTRMTQDFASFLKELY
ncbi:hypothetical protein F9956_00010 [Bacteroides stercoris]|nr:hypothetical protein F9956_00010 [Bacteroides stercoris]